MCHSILIIGYAGQAIMIRVKITFTNTKICLSSYLGDCPCNEKFVCILYYVDDGKFGSSCTNYNLGLGAVGISYSMNI